MKPNNVFGGGLPDIVFVGLVVLSWAVVLYLFLSKGQSWLYKVLEAPFRLSAQIIYACEAVVLAVALLPLDGVIYLINRPRGRCAVVARGREVSDGSNVNQQSAALVATQTSRGRFFELRMTRLDSLVLSVAAVGLAFANPLILTTTALCHLFVGFFTVIGFVGKLGWLIVTPIVTVAVFGVLVGIGFAADRLGLITPAAASFMDLSSSGVRWAAIVAINVGGIVGLLFSYVGAADRLVEYQNRFGELPD